MKNKEINNKKYIDFIENTLGVKLLSSQKLLIKSILENKLNNIEFFYRYNRLQQYLFIKQFMEVMYERVMEKTDRKNI